MRRTRGARGAANIGCIVWLVILGSRRLRPLQGRARQDRLVRVLRHDAGAGRLRLDQGPQVHRVRDPPQGRRAQARRSRRTSSRSPRAARRSRSRRTTRSRSTSSTAPTSTSGSSIRSSSDPCSRCKGPVGRPRATSAGPRAAAGPAESRPLACFRSRRLAKRTGIPITTLRFYERELPGLFRIRKTAGGHRRYAEEDVERFATVRRLSETEGLGLAEIRRVLMSRGDAEALREEMERIMASRSAEAEAVERLERRVADLERRIGELKPAPPRRRRWLRGPG